MMGEEDIPNSDEVEDEDEYSRDLTPDPRHSEVEDISLWSEEDFYNSPD